MVKERREGCGWQGDAGDKHMGGDEISLLPAKETVKLLEEAKTSS